MVINTKNKWIFLQFVFLHSFFFCVCFSAQFFCYVCFSVVLVLCTVFLQCCFLQKQVCFPLYLVLMYNLLSFLFSAIYGSYVLIIILNVINFLSFIKKKREKIINMIVINKIKEQIYNSFMIDTKKLEKKSQSKTQLFLNQQKKKKTSLLLALNNQHDND